LEKYTWQKPEGFFLSTARLDPLKRVDVIVEAFKKMGDRKLVVVSGGSELKNITKYVEGFDNITVLGWVDDERLQKLLATCLATIYLPKDEDFGMSPVESMASGKPVIGVAEGGLLETVVPGKTGVLLPADQVSPDALCQAVREFSGTSALTMRDDCQKRAAMFSRNIFLEKMKNIIAEIGTG
jgi:glycosyltransferase involved in cell wall biosynthesis